MTDAALTYRWSREGFLRAWEAGAFEARVEYVDGEVIPVVIGDWHGQVTVAIGAHLAHPSVTVTAATLPAGDSLPDPDCWVRRRRAQPESRIADRLSQWRSDDVLLVVEVSDETTTFDLGPKARLYGSAGFAVYWVITREALYVHTEPTSEGYRLRTELRRGETAALPYGDTVISIDDLISAEGQS